MQLPDDQTSCDACSFPTRVLTHAPPTPFGTTGREGYWFCDLCYNSFSANSVQYPDQYPKPTGELLRHMCLMTNIVLQATRTPQPGGRCMKCGHPKRPADRSRFTLGWGAACVCEEP